jgi:hypothetical protein
VSSAGACVTRWEINLYDVLGSAISTWQNLSIFDLTRQSRNWASAMANQWAGASAQNSGSRKLLQAAPGAKMVASVFKAAATDVSWFFVVCHQFKELRILLKGFFFKLPFLCHK